MARILVIARQPDASGLAATLRDGPGAEVECRSLPAGEAEEEWDALVAALLAADLSVTDRD